MKKYLFPLCFLFSVKAMAAITVRDDSGQTLTLTKPALRIVSLAPHITELLFAAGGGEQIVGTISYSDYPAAAKKIPLIGDDRQIDMERVVALKPDLLIVWLHGNTERQLVQLKQLGIPVFYSEPQKLDDIPDSLDRFGRLLGKDKQAQQAAVLLRSRLASLKTQYGRRPTVRLFYQVAEKPLYTLNGKHIVSDAIKLCGGENIFAELKTIAPNVGVEAVLQRDPEAIFGGMPRDPDGGINMWRKYATMNAVRRNNLFFLNDDLFSRAGPRLIEGAVDLCEKIERARKNRAGAFVKE